MCVPRLVAALSLALVVTPFLAFPAEAADAPKSWRLLHTFSAPSPGVHERTFTILPTQDYDRYILMAYDTEGLAGGVAFQVNQAGLAEVQCRGAVVDLPLSGVNWFCDDIRPNHSYRVIFSSNLPTVHLRLFGFDV